MIGREFLDQARYSRELVPRESVRDDKHSAVRTLIIEKLNRESYKIISIPGHQTSLLISSKLKLLSIRHFTHPGFMGAECIDSTSSKYFTNLRAKVLIQVEFHDGDPVKG